MNKFEFRGKSLLDLKTRIEKEEKIKLGKIVSEYNFINNKIDENNKKALDYSKNMDTKELKDFFTFYDYSSALISQNSILEKKLSNLEIKKEKALIAYKKSLMEKNKIEKLREKKNKEYKKYLQREINKENDEKCMRIHQKNILGS